MRPARAAGAFILALALLLPGTVGAADGDSPDLVFFPETGHYLGHGFLDYWRHQGGLASFGYPITEELSEGGLTVQYFERAVFEYHPDAPENWKVQLRRLGATLSADRQSEPAFQPVSAGPGPNCTFYPATGHRLCFGFRDYWWNHGALRAFGYPLSEEFSDPQTGFTTQYFERAVFEYHPGNPPGYQVLLGLLGDVAAGRAGVDRMPLPRVPAVPAFSPNLWPPERCRVWQVQVERDGGDAATGHRLAVFVMRNASPVTCTVYGYVGMQMLDSLGNPLPTRVIRGGAFEFPDVAPRLVTLGPGETGSFALGYTVIPTGDQTHEAACPQSTWLEVTPPDEFDHLVIPAAIDPCEGAINVSPVVAGVPGPENNQAY